MTHRQNHGDRLHLSLNAPAVLGFAALCLLAQLLSLLTGGASNTAVFSVYRASLLNPLTWLRMVTHVFGHTGWDHLIGNLMYILILGPMLEEKYGTSNLIFVMLAAALATGLIQFVFFPGTRLLGASGVVFAMILLSSITGDETKSIPLTFILVAVLYIGQQIYQAFAVQGNISYMAHIVGGLVGAALGFTMRHFGMDRARHAGV